MPPFSRSWSALRAAVDELSGQAWERPSGCAGWLVRDLVCHLLIGAQDVLITLVTPVDAEPTVDETTYWTIVEPPTGEDPLDALIPRLAAAYGEPRWLKLHFDDVGAAAGRAAELADPGVRVSTQEKVLTVGDYLSAYVLEWTLHHLDLVAHLPSITGPPPETLAIARRSLEKIGRAPIPTSFPDRDALLIGTGRRAPTDAERIALDEVAMKIPIVLG
jgi:hypothetical protein